MELQIKRIQREKGVNNLVLAERLGITPQYAGAMASGKVGASLDKYEKIAEALGVHLWQLFAPKEEYTLTEPQTDSPTAEPQTTDENNGSAQADAQTIPTHSGEEIGSGLPRTDTDPQQQYLPFDRQEPSTQIKPDLILIDRETGEPTRYVRID